MRVGDSGPAGKDGGPSSSHRMLRSRPVAAMNDPEGAAPHHLSVVIPVYRGEQTLANVVQEIVGLPADWMTAAGERLVVDEILLVWDRGPDRSDDVIRRLAAEHGQVRAIWLSRNFGQHAATLAGMASSGAEWIVTLDEDGQHDIRAAADMLDVALAQGAAVVYAQPTNTPPHGAFRNAASRLAKQVVSWITGSDASRDYQSFRLMLGEVGRSVAAYAGSGVYLDVALGWVAPRAAVCPVTLRDEGGRPSGYTVRALLSHFWRLVISSGTRTLRAVSFLGLIVAVVGAIGALVLIIGVVTGLADPGVRGWASTMVAILLTSGAALFSLGVIAEYVGAVVNMAMGKPLYLVGSDPQDGPLGRRRG